MNIGTSIISKQEQRLILKEFYRTKLKKGEKIIDNRDGTIAKKLNINVYIVAVFLQAEMQRKEDKLKRKYYERV